MADGNRGDHDCQSDLPANLAGFYGAAASRGRSSNRSKKENGCIVEIIGPYKEGELALKPGGPSMFRGYLHDEERYEKCFVEGWYLTGDLAYKDEEGYFWFIGRADDIIKTSGHMVGPFEVESILMEHPSVAEAGAIGKPDPTVGQLVKAFVALKEGFEPSEELRRELIGFGRKKTRRSHCSKRD